MSIADNWKRVQERVRQAAYRAGRDPADIKIVAVSKTFPVEKIKEAVDAGIQIIGENRVQEAWSKYQELGNIATWHLVGHLQTNKVKRALQMFDTIHSVDSLHLAQEINKRCSQLQREVAIFLEIKTSTEPTKYGLPPEEACGLVEQIIVLPHINLIGLMTIGKFTAVESEVRSCFQLLAKTKNQINDMKIPGVHLTHLSMGMSGDFEWAIEEGATYVRIGSAIFGARS